MTALIWLPVALVVAVLMDAWAALLHGVVWHGSLWRVHRSHHAPRAGKWEANDALSLLHAPIAIALILYGCIATPSVGREIAYGVGLGMTAFGVAYTVVHDGLVHGRLPVAWLGRFAPLAAVVRAHQEHHKGRHGGAPYGLFLGPWELSRATSSACRDKARQLYAASFTGASPHESEPT